MMIELHHGGSGDRITMQVRLSGPMGTMEHQPPNPDKLAHHGERHPERLPIWWHMRSITPLPDIAATGWHRCTTPLMRPANRVATDNADQLACVSARVQRGVSLPNLSFSPL